MSTIDDIYGKDTYQPSRWQRLKDWWNCKIRGNHHLPIYVSTGVYKCSRCDYQEVMGERVLDPEIYKELEKIQGMSYSKSVWLTGGNVASLDELSEKDNPKNPMQQYSDTRCDYCYKPLKYGKCPDKVDCELWDSVITHCHLVNCEEECKT